MESLTGQFENALMNSPIIAYLLVYLAGVLTSFTPCVLPLLPIAVGTITSTARKREFIDGRLVETVTSKSRAFLMGGFYALGLAAMFSILGVVAALSGKAVFGKIASSPAAYLVFALLMFLLGLWLWKGDRLDPGAWLRNRAFQSGGKAGFISRAVRWYGSTRGGGAATTFAFGFITGILAGPCTAPVIALVLAHVATSGSIAYGTSLMFVYAIGLATLMVIAGTSATMAMRIKKQGGLANKIKAAFIAIMFFMTCYYLYQAAYFGGLLENGGDGAAGRLYRITTVDKEGPPPVKAFKKGATLVDFSYEEVLPKSSDSKSERKKHKFTEHRGKVVYMPFWGIWCVECLKEVDDIKNFEKYYAGNNRVVLLSVDVLDDPSRVRGFLVKKGITYPVAMDSDENLVERIGATAFPLNLIVGPDGRIAYSGSTFPKDHKAIIEKLLKEKE